MPPANSPEMASPTRSPPPADDSTSPTRATQPDPLSYLSSPAPDLASTLYTQADEAADEANASFLRSSLESLDNPRPSVPSGRSRVDPQRDPRRPGQTEHSSASANPASARSAARLQQQHDSSDDIPRRERLQRVLARLNRMHDPTATSTTGAYGDRTPSPNRQSLYDWAPAYAATRDIDELEAIQRELLRLHPHPHPELLRILSQNRTEGSRSREREASGTSAPVETGSLNERRERLLRDRERRRRETEWVNLRTRAAMQRSRQDSPQSFDRMLRYVMERERSGLSEEEDRARVSGWYGGESTTARSGNEAHRNDTNASSRDNWLLPPPANANEPRTGTTEPREQRERLEAFRRSYLAENMPPRLPRLSTPPVPTSGTNTNPNTSPFLDNAIKYLDELRDCVRYEDALSAAIDHGLATKEFFADKHDDFVMDLGELTPLSESSWLQPGSVSEGHQHATNSYAALTHNASSATGHVVEQINPNYRTSNGTSSQSDRTPYAARPIPFDATRPWASHQFTPPNGSLSQLSKQLDHSHDQWPVRVVIHAIDMYAMTLQGTMEAYDVPQPSTTSSGTLIERPKAGKKDDPITTFVEGHIIDSRTHSFLTPSKRALKKHGPHSTNARNATPYTALPNAIVFPSANAGIDAANWRKLPPFNSLPSDDEAARLFLSRARMEEINQQYIFMRWKERCFVHSKDSQCPQADRHGDQDRGHALTISGFYYVSLRRSDGLIEGLYFDPASTPVQHLRLKGKGMGWPSFQMR